MVMIAMIVKRPNKMNFKSELKLWLQLKLTQNTSMKVFLNLHMLNWQKILRLHRLNTSQNTLKLKKLTLMILSQIKPQLGPELLKKELLLLPSLLMKLKLQLSLHLLKREKL